MSESTPVQKSRALTGNLLNVGLRDDLDVNAVLVCATHRDRLRSLRPYEAERLCRYLRAFFGYRSTS